MGSVPILQSAKLVKKVFKLVFERKINALFKKIDFWIDFFLEALFWVLH